jgi:hypothetical protein
MPSKGPRSVPEPAALRRQLELQAAQLLARAQPRRAELRATEQRLMPGLIPTPSEPAVDCWRSAQLRLPEPQKAQLLAAVQLPLQERPLVFPAMEPEQAQKRLLIPSE